MQRIIADLILAIDTGDDLDARNGRAGRRGAADAVAR
jgi:hypothetical protein